MTLAYFQLDRFADQAERDAKAYAATAEYCENRAVELVQRAAELRKKADQRAADAETYRADAERLWQRQGMEAAE